jgi:hypothetical protein
MPKKGQDIGDPAAGVAFNPPPISLMAEASQVLNEMTAQLPPGVNGAIVGIATQSGWNAAVVHRIGESFAVSSWIGKTWQGGLTGGGALRAVW